MRVHDRLVKDVARQERECGGVLQELNSNAVGGVAGRPRRYHAPDVDFDKIERFRHTNPDYAADEGWQFRVKPVPAPVAMGSKTKSPIEMIRAFGNYQTRFCNSDERDRVNPGVAAGISCGYQRTRMVIPPDVRDRANGNGFSADAVWSIARLWEPVVPIPAVMVVSMVDMRSWPGSEQLAKMGAMTDGQLEHYFDFLAVGLTMPELDIAALVDPVHTTNYQTEAPGFTKSGLGPSCDYCIDLAIRDGTHKEVEWTKDLWICLLFFQRKKDRTVIAEFDGVSYKKGDKLWQMRPLRDYTKLNSCMATRIPNFWREFCPTVEAIRAVFPNWCCYMAVHDCKNAFHSVQLTKDSAKYCNSRYCDAKGRRRVIQAIGADQGISAIALFFPIWIRYGYFWFFGQAWLDDTWWADFVDDTICFGRTEAECRLKMKILNLSKRRMGLEVSAKQDVNVYKEVEFVGLIWTMMGITIGEASVKYILECLGKTPIGVKQARMVRGVLVQAKSAFAFSPTELLRFTELLAVITACIVEGEASGRYSTSTAAKEALAEFADRLTDQPRRYTNPDDILGDDRCLALLGDADPSAVVSTLWIIMRPNANDVCPADFEAESSILLGVHPKTLSGSSLLWHISEKELMVMVYGVKKFGKLISEAVARWTLSADQSEWRFNKKGQLLVPVPKICFASDSKAALGMLNVLRLPSGRLEHLTPKLERVSAWAEDCAETLYWPLARLFVPGEGSQACNSLCDFIVRFVGELRRMKDEHLGEVLPEELIPSPMTSAVLIAGAGDLVGSGDLVGIPCDMQLLMMPLPVAAWSEIHRAYKLDKTMHFGVSISDIYRVANGLPVSAAVTTKVKPWMGKVFFAASFRGSTEKILCHRRSFLQPYSSDDPDKTMMLVPVIPANAMVRVSGRPPYVAGGHDPAESLPMWQAEDLRADIVWWAHYCRHPHSRKEQTVERAMSVSWWPGIDVQSKMEYRLCSICNDVRLVLGGVALGMMAQGRFSVVQMDDAKLSPELQDLTGFVSVLVLTCVTTGAVCYIPRKEMDCTSTAFHIFTSWVKENGWFRILKSDSDPAYMSQLIAVLLKLVGIKDGIQHIQNALGSHSRHVERSISVIRKVIREAEKYSDLKTGRDFEVFIAAAQIEANQLAVCDGSTVFERTRGVKAITDQELLAVRSMPESSYASAVAKFKVHEKQMIALLRDRIDALASERRVQQEKRAEYNYSHSLNKESVRLVHDMSSCEGVGLLDTVSYKGDCYILEAAEPVDQWPPARVFLRCKVSPATNCKWVSWTNIRPLSIDREPLLLPRIQADTALELVPGDVLVYSSESHPSDVSLGRVLHASADGASVHCLKPAAAKVVTFVNQWQQDDDESELLRRVQQPAGYSPLVVQVNYNCFITTVTLQKNHTLDSASKKYLESLGVVVDLKSHS